MPIYLPATTANLDRVADAAADRRGARQVRHRPGRRQTRGGDCAPQPDAPPEARARAGRGNRAEEHPDDRTDRCRQDRDRAPSGASRAVAVRQGRGVEVHRGRLRRPRRRVDGPRPRRARRRHDSRGAARGGPGKGGPERRRAAARPAPAADAARRSRRRCVTGARRAVADARALSRTAARRPPRHARRRARRA